MDFTFSQEQAMLRDAVRRLMDACATPEVVRRLDRDQAYPYELYGAWVEQGLLRMPFPAEVGGLDGSVVDMAIIAEELSRKSFDLFTAYSCSIFCGLTLLRNGTPAQRSEWLPPLLDGSLRMSVAMSEPDAGSDLGAMRTTAVRQGGDWILNGRKVWATGAGARNNVINVYARTDPQATTARGCRCSWCRTTRPEWNCASSTCWAGGPWAPTRSCSTACACPMSGWSARSTTAGTACGPGCSLNG
ncbi:hypothetical protein GCM10023144_16360 [Pigmentiphaga soli]|uniref:Acyl-CoA dehydrogenase n=1 Tax=Pigmentiphaga soli TaxID=1007095 RepID=A0ABP8GTI6_9BURK